MVAARSAAMGFNRLVDARYDALNPRTAMRELPRGAMSTRRGHRLRRRLVGRVRRACRSQTQPAVRLAVAGRAGHRVLVLAGEALHHLHAGVPRPGHGGGAGGRLAGRRRTRRRGSRGCWGWRSALWVGGFDVLYACQDLEFDRAHGLRSIPVRFGVPSGRSLISRADARRHHRCAWPALAWLVPLGAIYLGGRGAAWRRCSSTSSRSCQRDDLSQVKRAFDLNGYVGICISS